MDIMELRALCVCVHACVHICVPITILMNCDLIQCAGMCLTTGSPEAGVGET